MNRRSFLSSLAALLLPAALAAKVGGAERVRILGPALYHSPIDKLAWANQQFNRAKNRCWTQSYASLGLTRKSCYSNGVCEWTKFFDHCDNGREITEAEYERLAAERKGHA